MDPSSLASVAANLLGVTIQITGSLYGNWEYPALVSAERLIYELSRFRNTLQSLEATALSMAGRPVSPPPKDLLKCLEDAKICLISLGSKLLRQDPQIVFSFQDSSPPWRSFNAPMSSQYSRHLLSTTEDIQSLQACLSKLNNSIAQSVLAPTEELFPKRVGDPTGSLWKDRAEYCEFHKSIRKSWLNGPVNGSSLAINSVQELPKDNRPRDVGLAYFYFSYKTPTPIRNVALALLEQLNWQLSSPDEKVERLEYLAAKEKYIPFPDIVSAVIAVSGRFQRAYIIIDGLDECFPGYQKDLLYLLTSIKSSPVQLFASSRSHLFDIFQDSPAIHAITSRKDITIYAKYRLQDLPAHYDNLHDSIINALLRTGETHHMFSPIVIQLDTILAKATAGAAVEEIEQELEAPSNLHAAYRDIFERILKQDTHQVEIAKRTLTWLYYAQRPLETAEIIEIHRHDTTEIEADASLIVRSCMGLVQSEPRIAFTHLSVKEFLEEKHLYSEEEVASRSISYLRSRIVNRITSPETVHSLIEDNPLLNYAASFWGRHAYNIILRSPNAELAPFKQSCLELLKDELIAGILCHITFTSPPHLRHRTTSRGLVKSSSLHLAAYFGLDWVIDSLIPLADSAAGLDEWDRTPLHVAAESNFDGCVEALLRSTQMSPNHEDSDGETAWHYVAMSGNSKALSYLLKWSKGSSSLDPSTGLRLDKRGRSPLDYAAANGNIDVFTNLFSLYSANYNATELFAENATFVAITSGHIEIVKYLLSNRQVTNYRHLLVATRAGLKGMVQLLLDYGVGVGTREKGDDSAIVIAARESRNGILGLLVWNGALLDGGITNEVHDALPIAVKKGDMEGVRMLLLAGADPNALIDGNHKLIAYAARHGMIKIVEILLNMGAEATEVAFLAVENGHISILKLLLRFGVPANLSPETGQSLLEIAQERNHTAVMDLLRHCDPNISPRVVYSTSLDNVVGIQTYLEKSSLSDVDVALSDVSSQSPIQKQPEVAPLPEPSRAFTAATKIEKQSTQKPTKVEKELDENIKKSLPVPSIMAPDPGLFMLLTEPIKVGSVGLGSVIAVPQDPLSSYVPQDLSLLSQTINDLKSTSIQHDFAAMINKESVPKFAFELLRSTSNRELASSRTIRPEATSVFRERIDNHERALERIYHDKNIRDDIWAMASGPNRGIGRKQVFLVVGLLIASNLETLVNQEAPSSSTDASAEASVSHEGDKIFAIRYRSLKFQEPRVRPPFNLTGNDSTEVGVFLDHYFVPASQERLI
ncbi:hypothetical protein GGR51DRAFT_569793 [Nemania sp. FL0031]|nr:hypothetical protein GGR51DRAFT_569793 [Nemania sp. FL0031]